MVNLILSRYISTDQYLVDICFYPSYCVNVARVSPISSIRSFFYHHTLKNFLIFNENISISCNGINRAMLVSILSFQLNANIFIRVFFLLCTQDTLIYIHVVKSSRSLCSLSSNFSGIARFCA